MNSNESRDELCPECGAPIPEGATCEANFHALLFLEWEIPDGPGTFPHFFAVASYDLQHPLSMGYTVETVENLRAAVADALEGNVTINDIRHRVGNAAK